MRLFLVLLLGPALIALGGGSTVLTQAGTLPRYFCGQSCVCGAVACAGLVLVGQYVGRRWPSDGYCCRFLLDESRQEDDRP